MSATIKDLAKIAGVTNQTISNVFNRPELVKDSTRKRIHALAREMGYRPNVAARSLRMGLRPSVGLMVASHSPIEIENIFQSDSKLLAQLCLQCEQQDLNLVLGLMQQVITPASDWDALPRMMENAHVGPVICIKDMWDELAALLRNYNIPAVVIDGPACGLAAVQTDEAGAVEMLVDHLVSLGH
jgi:DNA-binding LacI/PurR family transcriptional regulator